jgi:eukaryotic-like serine/threonine-protein kinase
MELKPGAKLGPYELVSVIGKGGMGEVWRAHDPQVGRDVAIKVSAQQFTDRFEREVRAIGALNHPNICTLYHVGPNYLVMELVEGATLAERIKEGPIPLDEALGIAKQIADALEAAHEKSIVHRDLKPANIKIRPDGSVKVLDFGLAKAGETQEVTPDSPTMMPGTQIGMILGTAGYMSPEQARGKEVDKRADIWSFGVVLYEMVTGKRLFEGETVSDTLAAILIREPNLAPAPRKVRRLLAKCLEKDPKKRLRDIGDAWELLDDAPPEAAPSAPARRLWIGITAASLVAVAGWFAFFYLRPRPRPPQLQRFAIAAPETGVPIVALSPDGTQLVFSNAAPGKLWLRRLDSLETRAIDGTDGAAGLPFWSPDSRFVAFSAGGKLRKIDVAGGPAQVLCDAVSVIGGFWTADGKIVFSEPSRQPGLFEVSSAGGTSSPLPGVGQHTADEYLFSPVLLPDRRHFLYVQAVFPRPGDVYLGSLDGKPGQNAKKLLSGVLGYVAYVPSPDNPDFGYLLFPRSAGASFPVPGTLMAQPFDVRKLDLAGEPAPVADQVSAVTFSASLSGTLVYGRPTEADRQLTVFDRQGKVAGTVGEMGNYGSTASFMAFSPDGGRIAAIRAENIWIFDRSRGAGTRFTFGSGQAFTTVWSPDGSRIAFASIRGPRYPMYQKLSNGGGDEELLLDPDGGAVPNSWSGDGRFLLFSDSKAPNATFLSAADGWKFPCGG